MLASAIFKRIFSTGPRHAAFDHGRTSESWNPAAHSSRKAKDMRIPRKYRLTTMAVATLVAFSSPISAGERTFLPNMLPFPNASGPWDDALPRIVTLQPR